jgi:hypothetical protein
MMIGQIAASQDMRSMLYLRARHDVLYRNLI